MFRILQAIALVVACLACQGCYKGRVVAFQPRKRGEAPREVPEGTFDNTQEVNRYFWGLRRKPPSPVPPDNCVPAPLKEEPAPRKGSHAAAAILTRGIYSAIAISWQCAA